MPVYNLANVLGIPNDQINSMFSNPTFQQDFGQMFANNPNMYSGVGNLYTNNPTFKSAFQSLMGQQNWSQPGAGSGSQFGGGGTPGSGVVVNTGGGGGGGGGTGGGSGTGNSFLDWLSTMPAPDFSNAAPTYTGPGASAVQLSGGQPPSYASMFQPPALHNLSLGGNGQFGITQQAPQAPMIAASPFDPTSQAQMNTQMPTAASLQAQLPQTKTKSPTFFEQIAPYVGAAASILSSI
jgi:hypothetical protein